MLPINFSNSAVGAALNDAGLADGASPTGRPVAEFISENPQDSEISRDTLLSGSFPGAVFSVW